MSSFSSLKKYIYDSYILINVWLFLNKEKHTLKEACVIKCASHLKSTYFPSLNKFLSFNKFMGRSMFSLFLKKL